MFILLPLRKGSEQSSNNSGLFQQESSASGPGSEINEEVWYKKISSSVLTSPSAAALTATVALLPTPLSDGLSADPAGSYHLQQGL